MEFKTPEGAVSLFFMCLKIHVSQDLPTTEVATNGTNQSWGVVEDLAIFCALEFGCTPRLQQVHSPLVRAKCLLVGHHHLLK